MDDDLPKFKDPCPKCGAAQVYRKTVLEDARSLFLEIHACCKRCWHVWGEIYEKGIRVTVYNKTLKPPPPANPIRDVKKCPYCGKRSNSRTGFPFLFSAQRLRYHAHQKCARQFELEHGPWAYPPFGPPIEASTER